MSFQISMNNNHSSEEEIAPTQRAKANKVYCREGFNASKNIFNKKISHSNVHSLNVDSNAPIEDPSPSETIRNFQEVNEREGNTPKAFISFLDTFNKLTNQGRNRSPNLMALDPRQKKKNNNCSHSTQLHQNSPNANGVVASPSGLGDISPVDSNKDQTKNKSSKEGMNERKIDKKKINKFKKRTKINLFRGKCERKDNRAMTLATESNGEVKFMKPKFLKSVTSTMNTSIAVVKAHLRNIAENKIKEN